MPNVFPAAAHISAGSHLFDVRAQLLKQLDARSMGTLMEDGNWYEALGTREIDSAAQSAIEHAVALPLGGWPPLGDWEALADRARALGGGKPHATLLANLWMGSRRLSSGAVGIEQAEYTVLNRDATLFRASLLQSPGRAPECMIHSRQGGNRLLAKDGGERKPAAFENGILMKNQGPGYCDVGDPLHPDKAGRPCVVYKAADDTCRLFRPEHDVMTRLPPQFDNCAVVSVSSNGRYVAASLPSPSPGGVYVHDCQSRDTTYFDLPMKADGSVNNPLQVSVSASGIVFVATAEEGWQFDHEGRILCRTHLDCVLGNYRLGPDERTLLTTDATGTNLRLEDLEGGGSKTLRHPAATEGADVPLRIRSMAISPGNAWIATVSDDRFATLSVYDLVGSRHEAVLDPVLHVPLRDDNRRVLELCIATPWFEPDGSALNLFLGTVFSPGVQLVRLPLV